LVAAVYVGAKTPPAPVAREKGSRDGKGSTGVISIYMCCPVLKNYTNRKPRETIYSLKINR
jgi:hypothetical protein